MNKIITFIIISYSIMFLPALCNGQSHLNNTYKITKSQISNIKIVYKFSDIMNPIMRVYDENNNHIYKDINCSSIVKFNLDNDEALDYLKSHAIPEFIKRVKETIFGDTIAVTLFEPYLYNKKSDFVQSAYRDDLIIWKQYKGNFIPISLYPEAFGGCLYCSPQIEYFINDSLIIKSMGCDVGDEWTQYEYLKIISDSVYLYKREWNLTSRADIHKSGNPTKDASSTTIKRYYFDKKANMTNCEIDFNVYNSDGQSVYLSAKNDSLPLYDIKYRLTGQKPKFLKNIYVRNKRLRVGTIRGKKIPIFWDNNWYLTYINEMIVED